MFSVRTFRPSFRSERGLNAPGGALRRSLKKAAAAAGHEEVALLLAAARAREDEAKAAELAGQFE